MCVTSNQKIPPQSQLFGAAQQAYIVDCFSISSDKIDTPIEELYARLMSKTPKWFNILMNLRDRIVVFLGLKSTQDMAGSLSLFEQSGKKFNLNNVTKPSKMMDFFTVIALSENEIILHIKDKHLDMQTSLLRTEINEKTQQCSIIFSDVIVTHNVFGRIYLFFIMPIHKIIVKNTLIQAKRRGDI